MEKNKNMFDTDYIDKNYKILLLYLNIIFFIYFYIVID